MRRGLVAAILCLAAVGAALPAGAGHKHPRVEEIAVANWMRPTGGGHFLWRLVEVMHDERPTDGVDRTLAAVVRGDCDIRYSDEGSSSIIGCVGRGRIVDVGPGDFEMDALASAARIRVATRLGLIKVTWTARQQRGLYESQEACWDGSGAEGSGSGGGVFADARARGRVFGRAVSKAFRQRFSFLARGAMVTDCHPPPYASAIDWDRARAGDVVRIRTTLGSS